MKKKALAGSAIYWIAVSKKYLDGGQMELAFRRRSEAVHFIDHHIEGWAGWRLLQCSAFAEVSP